MAGRMLTGLAVVSFIALGLPEGSTGVAWPSIAGELDRPISRLGVLLVALVIGYFIASATTGAVTARFGMGHTLAAASSLSAIGLFGIGLAPAWAIMVASMVVLGSGAALVDAGLNAHTALHGGPRAMNLLHAAFGIGATIGPAVMTVLLVGPGSWRTGFVIFGAAQALLALSFLRTRHRWDDPPPSPTSPPRRGLTGVVVAGLVLFALYTGLEVAAGQWSFSVLTGDRGVGEVAAGTWIAAYWGSLTVGRLGASAVGERVRPVTLLGAGMAAAVAGAAVFWWDPGGAGATGLLLVGFGLAPVFPTLVLLTPVRVGADRATAVVGYQLAAAGAGAALVPGGIALVVERLGLGAVAPALVVVSLTMVLAADITRRLSS